MRTTLSGYYRNLQFDQSKTASRLFDVNKQISSGQKIQYAYGDTSTFTDTMRLDNEVTTLSQVKQNAQRALQFSTNTDDTMVNMTEILETMKVKLIAGANDTSSSSSRNAIALELRGLEKNFLSLANTSIDGKFIFSGTETGTKPIDINGVYQGNDGDLNAFIGSGVDQKYNINGADLFLGAENGTNRQISTFISLKDNATGLAADINNTLQDITGNANPQILYIRGTNHDGTSFKDRFTLQSTDTIDTLLDQIEGKFTLGTVNVSLNDAGHIVVRDKISGSSKLDFHIVAGETVEADIDDLVPSIEFMKSGLISNTSAAGSESAIYDRTFFTHKGNTLESNVSQIVKQGVSGLNGDDLGNSFAVDSTKLGDVFSSLTSTLQVEGKRLDGSVFNIDIDFGVPATVSGDYNYDVADGLGNTTDGADMTYRQLMDVVNMAINGLDPNINNDLTNSVSNATDSFYNKAIKVANNLSSIELSYDGKITLSDKNNNPTLADISLSDINSDNFANTDGSMAIFQSNNALTVSDPKTDFFKQLDEAIRSVELERTQADGLNPLDPRNGGIQNALRAIDDLSEHMFNQHSVAGAQSNILQRTETRTDLLLVTTETLRSETIDVDFAEAALALKQLELNYEAMLSSVSKISRLSLVNFL